MSGGTIKISAEKSNSLRVQTSAYGLCLPLIYGKQRVVANILTSATTNSINVSWDSSGASDLKDYQVWLSTSAGFDPATIGATWTGTATSHTFTGLATGTTYYIRVAARDVWGAGALNYSAQITQVTQTAS